MTSNSVALLSSDNDNSNFDNMKYKPFRQKEFDEYFHFLEHSEQKLKEKFKSKIKKKLNFSNLLLSIFPILDWLPKYNWKKDFSNDLIAGITVAVLHIPQGMAYSSLGAVPPIVGIYMAIFPVIIYMCMGTSRHISMGTFSVVCMMTSKAVYLYADNRYLDPSFNMAEFQNNTSDPLGLSPVQVASAVCITVGFWHVVLGLCQLGSLSVLMSDIMISGFTTGTAFLVIFSQLKHVFGIKINQYIGPFNVIYTFMDLFSKLDKTNFISLGVVVILSAILIIYNDYIKAKVQKNVPFPIPTELIILLTGSFFSSLLNVKQNYNLSTIGNIPIGLPAPQTPPLFLVPKLILDGLLISIIAFSINISMASILSKNIYKIDSNQELLASGISNIFGSFFSCIPFASSLSRSLVQLQVGGKTQLTSGISCIILVFVLLYIGPVFEPLPHCVLTSIVFVAVKGLLKQINDLKNSLKESYSESCVWCVTFLSVILLDIDYGLGLGVLTSLIFVIFNSQKVLIYKLGRLNNTNIYIEQDLYASAQSIHEISILKIIGNLNFINKNEILNKISSLSCNNKLNTKHIIIDMMSVSSVDTSTVKSFIRLHQELQHLDISLHLVKLLEPVNKIFIKCNFFVHFPSTEIYPTIHDAVLNLSEA